MFLLFQEDQKIFIKLKIFDQNLEKNRIFASKCDCGSISDLNNLKKKINKKMKKIDIVIANVGDGSSVPIYFQNNSSGTRSGKNFSTALNTARVFLPNLTKNKGSILFISSIAGLELLARQ